MSNEAAAVINQDVLLEIDDTFSQENEVEDAKEVEDAFAERQAAAQLQLENATGRALRVKQTFHSQLIIGRDGSKKMFLDGKETTVTGGLDEDGIPKIESIAASAEKFAVYKEWLSASIIESNYLDAEGNRYINLQLFSFEAEDTSEEGLDFVEDIQSSDKLYQSENVEEVAPQPSLTEPKKFGFWESFFKVEYQAVPVATGTSAPELAKLFDLFPSEVVVVNNQEATEASLTTALDQLQALSNGEIVLAGEPAAVLQSPDIPYTDVTVVRKEIVGEETVISFEFREVPFPTEVSLPVNPHWEVGSPEAGIERGGVPTQEAEKLTVSHPPHIISLDTIVRFEVPTLLEPTVSSLPPTLNHTEKDLQQRHQTESVAVAPPHNLPLVFEERLEASAVPSDTVPQNAQTEFEPLSERISEPVIPSAAFAAARDQVLESVEEATGQASVAYEENRVDFVVHPLVAPQHIAAAPEVAVGYSASQPEPNTANKPAEGVTSPAFSEIVLEPSGETTQAEAVTDVLPTDNDTLQQPVLQAVEVSDTPVVAAIPRTVVETPEPLTSPDIVSSDETVTSNAIRVSFESAPSSVTVLEAAAPTSLPLTESQAAVELEDAAVSRQLVTPRAQRSARTQNTPVVVERAARVTDRPVVATEELNIQNAVVLRRPVFDVDDEDDTASSATKVSARVTTQSQANAA